MFTAYSVCGLTSSILDRVSGVARSELKFVIRLPSPTLQVCWGGAQDLDRHVKLRIYSYVCTYMHIFTHIYHLFLHRACAYMRSEGSQQEVVLSSRVGSRNRTDILRLGGTHLFTH